MRTRYTILRETVANLAAAAEAQIAYLDDSFSGFMGGGSAEAYGNDELALEFEDSFVAVGHMLECGEITQEEIDALRPLDAMLARWSGPEHPEFWARRALFEDPRWRAIRVKAAEVLARLPDEARESDYMRSLAWEQRGGVIRLLTHLGQITNADGPVTPNCRHCGSGGWIGEPMFAHLTNGNKASRHADTASRSRDQSQR